MKTFADVIDKLGGYAAVAAALDQPKGTVSAWKTRGSVPAEFWADLIGLGASLGVAEVTPELLTTIAAARRAPAPEPVP